MSRKQKNIHYIYKTTCLITNRYYIGAHSALKLDDGYMGSGKRLRRSIRKYGEDNHKKEILEFLPDREKLMEREKEIVTDGLLHDSLCMNLMAGGQGGFISNEQQKKRSKCGGEALHRKRKCDPVFDLQYRQKLSNGLKTAHQNGNSKSWKETYSWVNKKHAKKTKQIISEKMKNLGHGKTNSQYGTCWITKDNSNKKIKKDCLNDWLGKGWKCGRVCSN